jgi:hypothetical protein
MATGTAGGSRLATFEELVDADALRSMIATAVAAEPIDEQSLRRGVWAYVCGARDLGTPPVQVIVALTNIVEASSVKPRAVRDRVTRSVILWCVDAYFGHLGERVGHTAHVSTNAQAREPLPPVPSSNR